MLNWIEFDLNTNTKLSCILNLQPSDSSIYKIMNNIFTYLKGDKSIWIIAILLGIISIVSVFSFIPILVKVKGLSYSYLFFKHTILLLMGFGIMYVIHRIPFKIISRLSKVAFYLSIILLVLTMAFGQSVNGADRWLKPIK